MLLRGEYHRPQKHWNLYSLFWLNIFWPSEPALEALMRLWHWNLSSDFREEKRKMQAIFLTMIPRMGAVVNRHAGFKNMCRSYGRREICEKMMKKEVMEHSSADFLLPTPNNGNRQQSYALIVLNYRLPRFTRTLWDRAQIRLCADGGANRLYDEIPTFFPMEDSMLVRKRCKPDVIKGDLDSIRPEVREFYDTLGSTILDESHDQDTTDFFKCVAFIKDCTPDLEKSDLILLVVGALGGRFDHELGNINILYTFSKIRIILLSNHSLVYLLPKTHRHEILVNHSVEGPHCGLIPIAGPSQSTTTSGLQWDLNDTPMSFGSSISTSNILRDEKVTVCSDVDLIWTSSIRN